MHINIYSDPEFNTLYNFYWFILFIFTCKVPILFFIDRILKIKILCPLVLKLVAKCFSDTNNHITNKHIVKFLKPYISPSMSAPLLALI